MTHVSTSTHQGSEKNAVFFDVHTTGCGYLNRARIVRPKQGRPYVAVGISLLNGSSENVKYLNFDCNVVGSDALTLVKELMDSINSKDSKVFARVKLGDLWLDEFTYSRGEKSGQTGLQWKARLLKLESVRVNGVVYQQPVE